jgi:ribose-phosphate pyrophosphokinase
MEDFRKTVLIAEGPFAGLAERTYRYLLDCQEEKERDASGGIHKFNSEDLVVKTFLDQEYLPRITRNVRGRDIFLFFPFVKPQGDGFRYAPNRFTELRTIVDACFRASASTVSLVAPHLPYLRQDRRSNDKSTGEPLREPVSARMVADLILEMGIDRLLTVTPHFKQFEGCFPSGFRFEGLDARVEIDHHMLTNLEDPRNNNTLWSADLGGGERIKEYARDTDIPFGGLCDKYRPKAGKITRVRVYTEEEIQIEGTKPIFVDDMFATCGTIIAAADELRKRGASQEVIAYAVHGILSMGVKPLTDAGIRPIITESIPLGLEGVEVVQLHRILGRAIYSTLTGKSISGTLFNYDRFRATL